MRTLIHTVLFVLLFVSCTGRSSSKIESNDVGNIIDLTAGFNNMQSIRLSEIADSVTFIPFETTSKSLMGMGQKNIRFSPQYIYYYADYFDWKGKYCGSIIKKGNGPFEEPESGMLLFKDNHFYSKGSKFIEYDITGKPTGKVRSLYSAKEFEANNFLRYGAEFFAVGENFAVYDYPITIYFFNRNFETVSSRIVTKVDSLKPRYHRMGDSRFITYYKDKAFFYNFMNDTIFHVTDTGLEPQWVVSFNDLKRLPTQVILNYGELLVSILNTMRSGGSMENTELIRLAENKHKVIAAYETESYVFFLMTEIIFSAKSRGKTPPEPYIICYDKKIRKTIRVKGKGFVDDLLGMDFFYPQLGIFDEKMITYIWPYELLDYIEECKSRGHEVNPKLIALSKKIKQDDNPILILAHLKK